MRKAGQYYHQSHYPTEPTGHKTSSYRVWYSVDAQALGWEPPSQVSGRE